MTNIQGRRPQPQRQTQPKQQPPIPEESNVKKTLVLFIATFFVTLFFLIFIVQNFSPQVDTEIVETSQEEQTTQEDANSFQRFVDDRLKWIQQEDNGSAASQSKDNKATDEAIDNNSKTANENPYPDANKREELVRTPKSKFDDVTINETIKEAQQSVEQVQHTYDAPVATPKPSSPKPVVPFKMTKVYIGNYSTMEQALSTQTRIMDSGLNVSPFIKEVNGNYTVQVGSFSSSTKAQELINKLNSQGFYGRTVQE